MTNSSEPVDPLCSHTERSGTREAIKRKSGQTRLWEGSCSEGDIEAKGRWKFLSESVEGRVLHSAAPEAGQS